MWEKKKGKWTEQRQTKSGDKRERIREQRRETERLTGGTRDTYQHGRVHHVFISPLCISHLINPPFHC